MNYYKGLGVGERGGGLGGCIDFIPWILEDSRRIL